MQAPKITVTLVQAGRGCQAKPRKEGLKRRELRGSRLANHSTAMHGDATPAQLKKGVLLNYGGNAQDEMEVTIRLDRGKRPAHICSTWPEWSRKPERLYGLPKNFTEREGRVTSALWVVPIMAIRVRRPSKGQVWTTEEWRAAGDRLKIARSSSLRTVNTVG